MWIDERGSSVLDTTECRRLLALGAADHLHGHLAFADGGAPVVLPVDFAVDGPYIVIEVGEGLFGRIVGRLVAFQVDGTSLESGPDGERRLRWWSVLLRGLAVEVGPDDPLPTRPAPRVAEPGERLVRIRGDVVTGRLLAPSAAVSAGVPLD